MSTQTTTILLALSLAALACSANRVDLDAPVLEPGNEPSVLGLVRERVEKLAVDGERLFWSGTRVPRADGANAWFLRSCQKRDCAATLVTYDSQPYDAQMHGTGEFMSDFFAVSGGQSIGIARIRTSWWLAPLLVALGRRVSWPTSLLAALFSMTTESIFATREDRSRAYPSSSLSHGNRPCLLQTPR